EPTEGREDRAVEAPLLHRESRGLRSLGRSRGAFSPPFRWTAGSPFLLLHPEAVVFARPIEVDLAAAHCRESPLHSNRTDVDVAQDNRDHDKSHNAMPQTVQLHLHHRGHSQWHLDTKTAEEAEGSGPKGRLEGKHKGDAGENEGEAAEYHGPEEDLLASIELARGRMHLPAENAPTFQDPDDVVPVRYVVPDPKYEHQQQPKRKGQRQVVVRILPGKGDRAENLRPKKRQQKITAEHHVQPGNGQDNKAGGRQPMRKAIQAIEAVDHYARPAGRDPDAATQKKEEREQTDHAQHEPGAVGLERPIAKGSPVVAL